MSNPITNQDHIAGIPALTIRQFFIDCEEPLTAAAFRSNLGLDSSTAVDAFDQLVHEGYLKTAKLGDGATGLVKTSQALHLMRAATLPTFLHEEGYNIVLKLFQAVAQINVSPETAHRVGAVKIVGQLLIDSVDELPFIEAEILVEPIIASDLQIQRGLEALSAELAREHGQQFASDQDFGNWSLTMVKDRLYGVHKQLCLRFIIRTEMNMV